MISRKADLLANEKREALDIHEQLCAAVEDLLRNQLAQRGESVEQYEANLGALVEEASAAIARVLTCNSEREQWLYFRVSVRSEAQVNAWLAQGAAPMLRELKRQHAISGWWWLNKRDSAGPAVRLRICLPAHAGKEVELAIREQLAAVDGQFALLKYEPEFRLFGGAMGVRLAHQYFCADSEFLTDWMRQDDAARLPVIHAGLSLALIFSTLHAAGLDLFECWDVFDRVCDKRPSAGSDDDQIAPNIERLARELARSGPDPIFELFDGEKGKLLREHSAFIEAFGRQLRNVYFEGKLEGGLREFLAAIIFFHWNRVGMPTLMQSKLARAVEQELARLSRKGASEREERVKK